MLQYFDDNDYQAVSWFGDSPAGPLVGMLHDWLTPIWLGHFFFKTVILFRNVVQHKCDIFYMKLVQYNEC